ncbi:hypothetical protein C0Z16_36605 [Paraburkholderia rhynchosiae]|uniref:Uncharacterized protein n=1 Tax=Paraburkholderia rhynchosiae TaxID=487049 RepID=A0ABX4UXH0_9BURK|nr:hypothetical protein C0Z16_36605 [Paraburkholderia rhynchosiae]
MYATNVIAATQECDAYVVTVRGGRWRGRSVHLLADDALSALISRQSGGPISSTPLHSPTSRRIEKIRPHRLHTALASARTSSRCSPHPRA